MPFLDRLRERSEGNVVVTDPDLVEFALFGVARRQRGDPVIAELRVEFAYHPHRMGHWAVGRSQVPDQFRPVELDESNERGAGLGDNGLGVISLDVLKIGLNRELRAETDVEDRRNAKTSKEGI